MAERKVVKLKRKEAIVLAIDIGKNSRKRDSDGKTYFEKSIYCASMVLKKKILTESEDHLALILFGSSHTINHLSSEESCYDGIETVAGLGRATWDLFNRVNSLSPTNITPSDWISTFVLAADMLKNETENKVFTGLQIVMFSNLATDISFDKIDTIARGLKLRNFRLSILGKDSEALSLNCASDLFLKETQATAVNFDSVLPKISYYKQKEVIARSWNAPLSFVDVFDIKVFGYQKIDITTKSSNWLFSKNYDTQDLTTVKKEHSDENGEPMEVGNELPMDNFDFGDQIIPVIDLDTKECTYIVAGQRCLQVLGFVKATSTQISFLMDGGSYIFKPHKTDIMAFNVIFKAMVKRREVMLVRRVDLYINLQNIGALIPQKEDNEKFFVYVNLPYDDDKNDTYKLPSLDSIKSHLKKKISLKHTDAMDIDIDYGNTFSMPEYKNDIDLQSTYDCIVQQILTKIIPKKIQCSKKQRYHLKSIRENDHGPRLQDFLNTYSFKREFFENFPSADNLILKKWNVSNKLKKPPKKFIKNTKPPLKKFKKTFSIKEEIIENESESVNTTHFGYDEELDGSNELKNPSERFIENIEAPLNELKKIFSIKQEIIENESVNTTHFGYDEELDGSNELKNPSERFIENIEAPLNELKKTFSIKEEMVDNGSPENINTTHFGYDEELDGSDELKNTSERFIENYEAPLNEFKKIFSIKQEIIENESESVNTTHFGYDEELDGSNELKNPSERFIENIEAPLNKLKKTFSIKEEMVDNGSPENINTTHFGYDEELDGSDELKNTSERFIENYEAPLNEFKKTFSIKEEMVDNFSVEDNNITKVDPDEELDVSKQCVISPLNPIEDFKKLLINGFDSAFVCKKMHDVTLNLIEFSASLEDLMKPIAILKALREFYIINNDAKSYNDCMYLVKDAIVMSGVARMWSKFINSGIGLITNAEIEASDISQKSSEEFKKLSGDLDIDFIIDGVVN